MLGSWDPGTCRLGSRYSLWPAVSWASSGLTQDRASTVDALTSRNAGSSTRRTTSPARGEASLNPRSMAVRPNVEHGCDLRLSLHTALHVVDVGDSGRLGCGWPLIARLVTPLRLWAYDLTRIPDKTPRQERGVHPFPGDKQRRLVCRCIQKEHVRTA